MTDIRSTDAPTIDEVVEAYFAMWNEDDATDRAAHIATAWATSGAYADPLLAAEGHDALVGMGDAVHEQYPGRRFRRTSAIDSHHGFHRFGWQPGQGDELVVAGVDVAHVGDDGRLTGVVGFFGPLPDELIA